MKDPALARRLEAIGFGFEIVGRQNILTEPHLHRCACCSALFGDRGRERTFKLAPNRFYTIRVCGSAYCESRAEGIAHERVLGFAVERVAWDTVGVTMTDGNPFKPEMSLDDVKRAIDTLLDATRNLRQLGVGLNGVRVYENPGVPLLRKRTLEDGTEIEEEALCWKIDDSLHVHPERRELFLECIRRAGGRIVVTERASA